ncbi:MAG: hypothetical protein C4297_10080 [Gemmataceae bacterium]
MTDTNGIIPLPTTVTGEEKAATILSVLSPEITQKVLGRLEPRLAQRLMERLENLRHAPYYQALLRQVMQEFGRVLGAGVSASNTPATPPAAREEPDAERKHDDQDADTDEPVPVRKKPSLRTPRETLAQEDPRAALERWDPASLVQVLQGESLLTQTVVLGNMSPERAGLLLRKFPPELRKEITIRLGRPMPASEELLRKIVLALLQKAKALSDSSDSADREARLARLAAMLRKLERDDRREILAALEQQDAEAAARIRDQLYRFEDLELIEDRSMQKLLTEIDSKTLALALKNAAEVIRDKVMKNLSRRAQDNLREEMEFLGSVSQAQIDEARKSIVAVIQRLDQEGQLVIRET